MNKTVTINLSGQVFQIDEDAYEQLRAYLESIQLRFRSSEGAEEILADIEGRLAEMFQATLSTRKNVVSIPDVEAVMQAMGRPEDFGDDEEEVTTASSSTTNTTAGSSQSNTSTTTSGDPIHRKLFRDDDNKVVAGVLSGFSAYIGLHDPVWLRLVFALLCFVSFGTFLIVYFVMWFIIPKAVTASDKLQMKGEPINIDNIERTIREDLEDFKKNLNNIDAKPGMQRARSGLSKVVAAFLEILALFLKFIKSAFGLLFIVLGLIAIGTLAWSVVLPNEHLSPSPTLLKYFFNNQQQVIMASIAFALVVVVPFIGMIIGGFRLLLNSPRRRHGAGGPLGLLWVVGVVLAIATFIQIKSDFAYERDVTQEQELTVPESKTLHLTIAKDDRRNDVFFPFPGNGEVQVEKGSFFARDNVSFSIEKSTNGRFYIEKILKAKGGNQENAIAKAQHILYNIKQTDSTVYFTEYLSFPASDKLRCQEVELVLYMPEGSSVFLEKELRSILHDIKNVNNTYDGDMVNHLWTMTAEGLICGSDCDKLDNDNNDTESGGISHEYTPENFSTVKVNGMFDVHVVKGDKYRVSISGKNENANKVTVKVDDDVLNISTDNWAAVYHDHKVKVTITTPHLDKFIGNGLTNVYINDAVGTGLNVELNGASKGELQNVKVDNLTVHLSGASHCHTTGTTTTLDAEAAGASHLDGFDLQSNTARVEASGASHISVSASTSLSAEANGASHVDYKGEPKVTSSNSSGFSSIKQQH